MSGENLALGGETDPAGLRIAPTVADEIMLKSPLMREEIFGPILPVLTWQNWQEARDIVVAQPTPLAFYLFTRDFQRIREATRQIPFGGGCINDTVLHLVNSRLPFGGMGESGMGSYHGRAGFDTFTHHKSLVEQKNWMDVPLRYQPYTHRKMWWVRNLVK